MKFWLDDDLRVVTEIAKRMESKRRLATRRLDQGGAERAEVTD